MTEPKPRQGVSSLEWWIRYDDSDLGRTMDIDELGEYESTYVRCWNLITDRGWKKEGAFWVDPTGRYKYNNVYDAYRCQMHWETIRKP